MVHTMSVHKFLFSVHRLEDQTKKLHKDMKKSTEADIGVERDCVEFSARRCLFSILVTVRAEVKLFGFRT